MEPDRLGPPPGTMSTARSPGFGRVTSFGSNVNVAGVRPEPLRLPWNVNVRGDSLREKSARHPSARRRVRLNGRTLTVPSDTVSVRPFSLTLRLADGCLALFSRSESPRTFTFHGSLRGSGRTPATFTLLPKDVTRPNPGDLAVDIVPGGGPSLSGSIHSS